MSKKKTTATASSMPRLPEPKSLGEALQTLPPAEDTTNATIQRVLADALASVVIRANRDLHQRGKVSAVHQAELDELKEAIATTS